MLQRWKGKRWFHAHETSRFDTLNGLPLASFKSRAKAYGIDFLIVAAASAILGDWHKFRESDGACQVTVLSFLSSIMERVKEVAESVLYFAVALKIGNGQTPGKKLMKIRVVSLTHHGMGWWQSIERALGYGASLLEGGFGFFQFFLNQNRMCVHDRIAETIVIDLREPRVVPPLKTDPEELAEEASQNA